MSVISSNPFLAGRSLLPNFKDLNFIMPMTNYDGTDNNADHTFLLETPMKFAQGTNIYVRSININGDRSCFIVPKEINLTTLVDGAVKKTIKLLPKVWTYESLLAFLVDDTGFEEIPGANRFIASDTSKALTLQFDTVDFPYLSVLLGLSPPAEITQITTYNIPLTGIFPWNFCINPFQQCCISLGFMSALGNSIPIQPTVNNSFDIGMGCNNMITIPGLDNDVVLKLDPIINLSYCRIRLSTPSYNLLPHFTSKIFVSIRLIW